MPTGIVPWQRPEDLAPRGLSVKPNIGGELSASERSLSSVSLASIDGGLCVSAWLRSHGFRSGSGDVASTRRSCVWTGIGKGAAQPKCHGRLGSTIQAASADVARPVGTSLKGAGKTSRRGYRYAGNAQLAWDVDRIRGCNGRELRLGVQLDVRPTTGDRRSMFSGRR